MFLPSEALQHEGAIRPTMTKFIFASPCLLQSDRAEGYEVTAQVQLKISMESCSCSSGYAEDIHIPGPAAAR